MTIQFNIQVQDDHLEKISQARKPILAIAELIWNAVDADANRVDVILQNDVLGGLTRIEVSDNGHGIPYDKAEDLFKNLGGSWKKGGELSQEKKRFLHGQEGRGRFRAFSLGRVVDWDVTYDSDSGFKNYKISMLKERLKQGEISEEILGYKVGTIVTVTELEKDFRSLREDNATQELTQIFALYLRQYPDIEIYYDNMRINPQAAEDHTAEYPLPAIEGEEGTPFDLNLEIVEWKMPAERRLFLCDDNSFPLTSIGAGIQAPGFSFTAYLKSTYFAKLMAENRLDFAELDQPSCLAIESAKHAMRDHFRKRTAEKASGLVEKWQEQNVYPYEGQPSSRIEEVERQVFNVVALNVNHYLPAFENSDEKTKKFQMRLLRNAIEHGSTDLSRIISEVLELPSEKRKELVALLDRTTLSHIIGASKIITDRLEFLQGLETLVFDDKLKHDVYERTQLHRILAENAWIFGEHYHLSVDDESLTEVLKSHIEQQKLDIEIDSPVNRLDGRRGIIDLMFSRNTQLAGSEQREHLIVELKRPNVPIKSATVTQIQSYAFAVAADSRFSGTPTKWVFWAISGEMDEFAQRNVNQLNRPKGMLYQSDDPAITIWVKTWSQIINECRSRLRFFSEKLGYAPDRDASLAHLKTTYSKYLADLFATEEALESPVETVS